MLSHFRAPFRTLLSFPISRNIFAFPPAPSSSFVLISSSAFHLEVETDRLYPEDHGVPWLHRIDGVRDPLSKGRFSDKLPLPL